MTAVPISKRRALDLIETVILPLSGKLRADQKLRRYFADEEVYLRHSIKMGHLAVAMLFAPGQAEQLLRRMHQAHAQHGIPAEIMDRFMEEFIQRYIAWARMSKLVPEQERSRLEEEAAAYLARCREDHRAALNGEASRSGSDDDGPEEEGFAYFDGSDVDAAIEQMHTTEQTERISAAEFMASGELLPEQVSVIMDEFEELEALFERYVRFEPAFIDAFQTHLNYLADTLYGTFEFTQMGYSLQQLIRILDQAKALGEEQQALLFTLLEQLILDLLAWAQRLFVDQDAVDIHYLDAALLASIAQIEMMFVPADAAGEGDADDDFLF